MTGRHSWRRRPATASILVIVLTVFLVSANIGFADVGEFTPDNGLAAAAGGIRNTSSDTLFNMSLTGGAHCAGNSSAGYVVRNYVVGEGIDPALLNFTSQGLPAPQLAHGAGPTSFVSALPSATGSTWMVNPGSGSPFLIAGLPQLSLFKLVGLVGITAGSYRLGIACVNSNAGYTIDGDNFWEVPITIGDVTATTFTWRSGWAPVAPTLSGAVSGDGIGLVQFTAPSTTPSVNSLTATVSDITTPTSWTLSVPVASSGRIDLTGLTNGHVYRITLTATNTIGSATSAAVTILPTQAVTAVPPAPTSSVATTLPSTTTTTPGIPTTTPAGLVITRAAGATVAAERLSLLPGG